MTVVKVVKLPKLFQKPKDKCYPMTPQGGMQMQFDLGKAKEAKISGVVSIVVIVGMFTLGFLSKEFLVMILATKGMSKVASLMVG